jgi:hypothetical protein
MTDLEQRQIDFAAGFGLALNEYKALARSLTTADLISVLELLKAKTHKSKKRERYAADVRAWLKNPTGLKPLPAWALKDIECTWPVRYRLPI